MFCDATCPCNANGTLWGTFTTYVFSDSGYYNFESCPLWDTVSTTLSYDEEHFENGDAEAAALKTLEEVFTCAGMCADGTLLSPFYTFSNVSAGPPVRNCTEAMV